MERAIYGKTGGNIKYFFIIIIIIIGEIHTHIYNALFEKNIFDSWRI